MDDAGAQLAARLQPRDDHLSLAAQPDTPAKLAGFAHAFEFLEVGAYEELRRVAARANAEDVERAADAILVQERTAARKIAAQFDGAVEATLHAKRVEA